MTLAIEFSSLAIELLSHKTNYLLGGTFLLPILVALMAKMGHVTRWFKS